MVTIQSFAPVVDSNASVLVLGSMPGKRSLDHSQYYAHPRNAFWRIMSQLLDFSLPEAQLKTSAEYLHCLAALQQNNIALWDVLQSCQRDSSLDADIVEASIQPNDFGAFYGSFPSIERIYFNGAKAEQSYRRYVLPGLCAGDQAKPSLRLPSTSPAHASMNFEQKLAAWQVIRHG